MRAATTGLTLSLSEAKSGLTDLKGNLIEFEEQEDGTYQSKEVEGDSYTYSYTLNPSPVIVTVSVTKTDKSKAKVKAKPRTATLQEEKEAAQYAKLTSQQQRRR